MKSWEVRFLIFLFLAAFSIRLLFLIEVADSPVFVLNFLKGSDMEKYVKWGNSISSGDWLGSEAYWQAPLFPYMLGIVFKLSGGNVYIPCFIQVILSAFTCVLIYLIAREAFNAKAACVSSVISCFYGPFILYCAVLLSETLGIFLISLTLFFLLKSLKKLRKGFFLTSGVFLGLASLARPNFLILAPFVLLILFLQRKRSGWKISGLFLAFCAGLALIILPVTVRNYVVSGRAVIISANAFETYRLANSYDSVVLNFAYPDMPMMPVSSCAFWKHQLKKAIFFWWGYEVPQNVNYYLFAKFSKVLRLPLFPFWLIAPLALTGAVGVGLVPTRATAMVSSTQKGNSSTSNLVLHLFNASYYVSIVIFYIASRLRLPIMVGLIPFAGFCLCSFYEELKLRTYKRMNVSPTTYNCSCKACFALVQPSKLGHYTFVLFVILVLLMIPWQVDRIRAVDYRNLGLAMFRKGMVTGAVSQFRKYLELNPEAADRDNMAAFIKKLKGQDTSDR